MKQKVDEIFFKLFLTFVIKGKKLIIKLGEMVNLQKANLIETPTRAFWSFHAWVDFMAS